MGEPEKKIDYENWEPPKGQLEAIVRDGILTIERCVNGIPIKDIDNPNFIGTRGIRGYDGIIHLDKSKGKI